MIQSSSKIVVELPPGAGRAYVTCDGEELGTLSETQKLEITAAEDSVTLLHPKDYNYYDLLRSKLHWGRANRAGS